MSQSSELVSYVKRVGENINIIYKRLEKIEAKINTLSADLSVVRGEVDSTRADVKELRENFVSKSEFDDFVKKLTESFSAVIMPAEQTEETE